MNQTQRTFLIKKIEETVKVRQDALRRSEPEAPNLNNYLLHAVMSGNFEIRTQEEIKEMIRQKALNARAGDSHWLAGSGAFSDRTEVHFKAYDLFIVPEEYKKLYDEYKVERDRIWKESAEITIQAETLITRIQLASDKTLQTMINEVDDMGNISLLDSKLKMLTR